MYPCAEYFFQIKIPVNFGGNKLRAIFNRYKSTWFCLETTLSYKTHLAIVHEGDTIKYKRERGDDIFEIAINIGQEYTEQTYGHMEVRICKWEGDKLVIKAVEDRGHWTSSIECIGDRLIATETSAKGITGKRIFKRI